MPKKSPNGKPPNGLLILRRDSMRTETTELVTDSATCVNAPSSVSSADSCGVRGGGLAGAACALTEDAALAHANSTTVEPLESHRRADIPTLISRLIYPRRRGCLG
jgi:hypothetical protein